MDEFKIMQPIAVSDVSEEFYSVLEQETNPKIKKGMSLFLESNNNCRVVFLHGTGFKGCLTAESLRQHLKGLDTVDGLDLALYDMKENIENS